MDIKTYLREKKELVDLFLKEYFSPNFIPLVLKDSITYSLSAGGKRIRPILCLAAHEACDGDSEDMLAFASSIELIHTYSLIHDDLPAMDNDDLKAASRQTTRYLERAWRYLQETVFLQRRFI